MLHFGVDSYLYFAPGCLSFQLAAINIGDGAGCVFVESMSIQEIGKVAYSALSQAQFTSGLSKPRRRIHERAAAYR